VDSTPHASPAASCSSPDGISPSSSFPTRSNRRS
jgi:hypothetical protein